MESEFTDFGKQTSSVKLIKNSKGYTWEIKVYNDDLDLILENTKIIDEKLKERYGNVQV